jgi:hypothetical protein
MCISILGKLQDKNKPNAPRKIIPFFCIIKLYTEKLKNEDTPLQGMAPRLPGKCPKNALKEAGAGLA